MPADGDLAWTALERLLEAALRERASHAALLGVRPVDLDALRHVVARAGTTPAVLARVLQMSSGGTTAVVDRLETAQLVRRRPHPGRRRRVALEPTAHGRAALQDRREALFEDVRLLSMDGRGGERRRTSEYAVGLADAFERQAERVAREVERRDAGRPSIGHTVVWG